MVRIIFTDLKNFPVGLSKPFETFKKRDLEPHHQNQNQTKHQKRSGIIGSRNAAHINPQQSRQKAQRQEYGCDDRQHIQVPIHFI